MKNTLENRLSDIKNGRFFSTPELLSVDDLSLDDVGLLLDWAKIFSEEKTKKSNLLRGVSIGLTFFESSTRTRSSFEWAGKHLGADTINIGGGTAEKKGESLLDIAQTLSAMHPEFLVVRTSKSGLPEQLSRHTAARIINAGDGWHEHPSQALLDAKTILDAKGSLQKKVITFVGDVIHSRVFGSVARLLKKMGAHIQIAAPATFVPEGVEEIFGATVFYDVEKALKNTDVIYILRVQSERGATGGISTLREYSKAFGISTARFHIAKKGALLMHPGPIQRDVDVHHALVTLPQSQIWRQVENGLALRKAIFYALHTGPAKTHFSAI